MMPSFVLPANGAATPESIARKRKLAELMMREGTQTGPIGHWSQGAARMVNALMGGIAMNRADKAESEGRKSATDALARALSGDMGSAPSQQDPNGAMMEAINNPWQSPQGSAMAMDMWKRQNTPKEPDWQTFNQGNDVYRWNAADPNSRPEIFHDGPEGAAAAPEVKEIFDEQTGQKLKVQWNGTEWVPLGGKAVPDNGITVMPDGTVQIGGSGKPLTEAQSKDTVFATRAEGALQEFEPVSTALTGIGSAIGGQIPVVGNYLKDPQYRKAEQSGRDFLAAILRKDTGAAVTDGEMVLYGEIFLPKPGDDPATLSQKSTSRRRAVEAIKAGMPPQAIINQEKALRNTEQAAPGAMPEQQPTMEPPKRLKFNPETGDFE